MRSFSLLRSTRWTTQPSRNFYGRYCWNARFFSSMLPPSNETEESAKEPPPLCYEIPQRIRQKVVSASDAVALVRDGDTLACSGFASQGGPEAVLQALGGRYAETGRPNSLTLLFGGGPGDWDSRGLNHLARTKDDDDEIPPMLRRTIGSHYGQVPKIEQMALENMVEAWTLPLGSVSRMIRAQSTHSPGHITNVGLGTYVDPDGTGGAANEAALASPLQEKLVTKIDIEGQTNLIYKALPINVAVIRGTTADAQGNITVEQESLLCDQKITAAAAKNSGGIVIAQVKRLAATGSLSCRSIAVPGPLVDAVVVVEEKDHDSLHPMSYVERHNPSLTGELRTPQDEIEKMPLDLRKIIARRAFFCLQPNKIVNLGIGLPEGVASVAAEEGMLEYVTLSTEPGVFGGVPASGHSFGPAMNATAQIELNQMFDFYDGGGLDMCFLGAAQVSKNGDVNVSRMSKNRLTGPGGFIDISQSTASICFMTPLTTKGLELKIAGDGTISIASEGKIKKFVQDVFEKTFSGDEALRRGQEVLYVTERAVFRRSAWHEELELIEIAPGIDLEKDVLSQMDFAPVVSSDLKTMDRRIFMESKMDVVQEIFGSLRDRFFYQEDGHTMYLVLFGITLDTLDDVHWFFRVVRETLAPVVDEKGPIDLVVNYDGFDLRKNLELDFKKGAFEIERGLCKSVKRYTGAAFRHAQLASSLHIGEWDKDELYDLFDTDHNGKVSPEELREGMLRLFQIQLTPTELSHFTKNPDPTEIDRESFGKGLEEVLSGIHDYH